MASVQGSAPSSGPLGRASALALRKEADFALEKMSLFLVSREGKEALLSLLAAGPGT